MEVEHSRRRVQRVAQPPVGQCGREGRRVQPCVGQLQAETGLVVQQLGGNGHELAPVPAVGDADAGAAAAVAAAAAAAAADAAVAAVAAAVVVAAVAAAVVVAAVAAAVVAAAVAAAVVVAAAAAVAASELQEGKEA